MLCVAVFVSGCGFFKTDTDEIIETIAEQQLYYDNASAEKLSKSIVLHSSAFLTPAFRPYFVKGKVTCFSSKKILYSDLAENLRYLTTPGYVDYDDLKKICGKLANLQEKASYKLTEVENTNWEYNQSGYDAYMMILDYPDMNQPAQRVINGIKSDLKKTYGIDLDFYSRNSADKSLRGNTIELANAIDNPDYLKKYGDIIVKNFSAVLDDKIPFTVARVNIYMGSTDKEIDGFDEYVMPDGQGRNLVYLSSIMWRGFAPQFCTSSISSLIFPYKDDFNRDYSWLKSLDAREPIVMEDEPKLAKKFKQMENLFRHIEDEDSLEKFLDAKESLFDEWIALNVAATVSRPTPNQSVQPQPTQPAQQIVPPVQSPVQSNANLPNSSEWLVFLNYYRAINDHRFADAYSCLTENCRRSQGSLEEFANGRQNVLSVEILDFQPVGNSPTITARYKIRTKDKIPGGVKVQSFNGTANLIKSGDTWFIDKLSSTLVESHTE